MSFARSLLPLVRPTVNLTRPACQQRPIALQMCRKINTAAASQSAGTGNLSSMVYHFRRQQHLPYFLEYLMWVILGSEALHLMWLKMEKKEYKEKTQHKIKLLEEIIDRIEKGQAFTDDFREEIRIVLKSGRLQHHEEEDEDVDDDYLDKLLALKEQEEQQAQEKTSTPSSESSSKDTPIKSTWPSQDDNGDKKKKAFFL